LCCRRAQYTVSFRFYSSITPSTLGVTRFYLERFFRRVIQAVSLQEGAIYAAVKSNNLDKTVKEFLSNSVNAKNPSMSAVDRFLMLPTMKNAVWEVRFTLHLYIPPFFDFAHVDFCSRS